MPPILRLGYIFPPENNPVIPIQNPRYPAMANAAHNQKVRELEKALRRSGHFDQVLPFHVYSKDGHYGEIDILALGEKPEWYEIKYRYTQSNLAKAISGFDRFRKTFPDFNGRAYYISCNGIVIEITDIEPEPESQTTQPPKDIIIKTYK